MLTIKSLQQIRTSRNVRCLRACLQDKPRLIGEERALMLRETRRLWLDEQWLAHFERAAGPRR